MGGFGGFPSPFKAKSAGAPGLAWAWLQQAGLRLWGAGGSPGIASGYLPVAQTHPSTCVSL